MTWLKFICILSLLSAMGLSQTPSPSNCPSSSKDIRQRVEHYLGQRLVSGTTVSPLVKSIDLLPDSCFRKVTMTIPATAGDVVMYLSPDERFLTSTLYDLSVDPQKEVSRIASNVTKLLMRDQSPRLAGDESRINLVEFVDLQCPYCKKFAEWYSALPDSLQRQTTLVLKNLPLPQHPWARSAAEYAVCASSQSPLAFRELSTFFLRNQSEITPQNLKDKVLKAFNQPTSVDLQQLEKCISGKEASQVVERDLAIAKQLNVNNTPTLFINGRRVLRVASAEELRHLLETELANNDSIRAQAGQLSAAH